MGFQAGTKATRNSDLCRSSDHTHGSVLIVRVTPVPKLIHSFRKLNKEKDDILLSYARWFYALKLMVKASEW